MEYCGRGSKIINMTELDINFVREQFPVFQNPKTSNFAFFENAGGTYVPKQVIEKLNDFMTTKKVQPYGDSVSYTHLTLPTICSV